MREDKDPGQSRSLWGTVGEFVQENLDVAWQCLDGLLRRPGQSQSLVCLHRGCRVNWNDAEGTWDCPGHGLQFDPRGRVIGGPATRGLAPVLDVVPPHAGPRRRDRMNANRLLDPRWTAALVIAATLLVFPARPAPAQEDPRPGPARQGGQNPPQPEQVAPEKAEATTGDAEILAQVVALDENEVALGRAAQQKKVTGPVLRYAKMIEQDHGMDMEQVRTLAGRLGLTLTTTTTVDQLHAKGQEAMSRLAPLTGEPFSRSFMTEMVNGHREALQMLDDFLKAAQNDELKQHLTEARAKIAMHLREGEKIQASIGRTDRPAPSSSEARPEQPLRASSACSRLGAVPA